LNIKQLDRKIKVVAKVRHFRIIIIPPYGK
jgi:hypothetical protein